MKFLVFSLIVILILSCVEVKFKSSQPSDVSELKEIPEELIGFWKKENDTVLQITKNSFLYKDNSIGSSYSDTITLSEDIVLKKFQNYYFLNLDNDKNNL